MLKCAAATTRWQRGTRLLLYSMKEMVTLCAEGREQVMRADVDRVKDVGCAA